MENVACLLFVARQGSWNLSTLFKVHLHNIIDNNKNFVDNNDSNEDIEREGFVTGTDNNDTFLSFSTMF